MQKCKLPKNHKQYYFINKDGNQQYPNFFNDIFSILTKKKPIRKTEFIVGGVTICPNKQSEEQDKLFDTWYFDEWQELYYQLKTDLEGEE